MRDEVRRLIEAIEGDGLSLDVAADLALHTTLRVGGPAALLVTAEDEAALARVAASLAAVEVPVVVLGRGSNILFDDDGWDGVVLRLGPGFRGISIDGTTVEVGGAEPMPSVATRTAQAALAGFTWGAAVPGSMGGGVRMNAGAHGADMSDSLVTARVLDLRTAAVEEWERDRLRFAYRSSALPSTAVVISVQLDLEHGDRDALLAEIEEIKAWRRAHQPLNLPSCGSVFANPSGSSAGELIERAGLKGARVGGAEISTTHANFIVTSPGARAADVDALITLATTRVRDEFGIDLRTEVVRPGRQDA